MLARIPSLRRPVVSAKSSFMPAPVKGWDDSQPVFANDPALAHRLDNWFPEPDFVSLRRGFGSHCDTGTGLSVETVMAYHGPTVAGSKLFAASGSAIYDVSTSTASSSVTGLSNARWQHVNFTTSGGSFLYCVNGADSPRHYNGSAWATPTITGSGVTPADFININVHKGRLFFIPKNSTKFVYLPVDSIQGTGTTFELGGVMSLGGYLVAMGTITIDGGAGPDDLAVFVTSRGQAIVYQGTDPSDANAWSLSGVFEIPPPIGHRCLVKVAGDLGILTIAGVYPLAKSMVVDRAAVANIAISQNINTTMTASAREYAPNFGWQLCVYPKSNMFIVNVPISEGGTSHQYVMNTRHGAWCRFIGQNAASFTVWNDNLYFGGVDGIVYKADSVAEDNGSEIIADMITGYSFFGSQSRLKQFDMLRPHIVSDGRVGSAIKVLAEWGSHTTATAPTNIVGATELNRSLWDDGRTWDDGSLWPAESLVTQNWRSVSGIGRAAAIWMRVVASSQLSTPINMQVSGFDVTYKPGGMI